MNQYDYEVDLKLDDHKKGTLTAPGFPDIEIASPEFSNKYTDTWTPEHLLAAAAASCFMTTFLAIAEFSKLEIVSFESRALIKMEKINSTLKFKRLIIKPEIKLASDLDTDKALNAIAKTEITCPATKAFDFAIEVNPVFEYLKKNKTADYETVEL